MTRSKFFEHSLWAFQRRERKVGAPKLRHQTVVAGLPQ